MIDTRDEQPHSAAHAAERGVEAGVIPLRLSAIQRNRASLLGKDRPLRKRHYLTRGICLALAITLASWALVACGDDSVNPQQPAAATRTAPTAEPTAAPTATPRPTATTTPTPTMAPTPTASAEPAAETGLAVDCLLGGVLDNVATITSCAEQAMQQVKSFSFEGEFNLLALFPSGEAGTAGVMTLSGAIMLPDRIRFEISFSPEGQLIQMAGVVIGRDTYIRDPESDMWFKGNGPDGEFLGVVQTVGLLQLPKDPNATLDESLSLDDGTKGYVLSYDQTGQQSGIEGLGFPDGTLVVVVGADDFLTREVRVTLEDVNDKAANLLTIRYHGYNETKEVEPPAQYVTIPVDAIDSESPVAPTVVGLARNEDGDVEVTLSEPVFVRGQVELYVLDPATGGWALPLIDGSGTATLTFDADAENRPPLVIGESQIAGFIFPTPDSQMTDSEGARLDLTFDLWTYE